MHEVLRRNLGFKIASLIMALLLWLFVMNQGAIQESNGDQTFTIPLVTTGQPANTVILTKLPSVQVRLQWNNTNVNTKEFFAYIDLSSAQIGEQNYEVKMDLPSGVKVLDLQPSTVKLNLDSVTEKVLPVKVSLTGTPGEGFVAGTPVARPSSVSVRGASTIVNGLDHVTVEVSVAGATETFQADPPVLFRDKNGNPIFAAGSSGDSLTANPSGVEVIVPIQAKSVASKSVPLKITTTGVPGTGKALKALIPTPSSVTLLGDANVLKSLDSITLGPLDISGLTEDKVFSVSPGNIILPEGVSLASGTSLSILAQIGSAPVDRVVTKIPVQIRDLPGDLELEEPLSPVDVTLHGLPEIINSISVNDIVLWVSGSGMKEGLHENVQVYWQAPSGTEITAVPKINVKLKIR